VAWLTRFRDSGNGARVRLFLRQYNTTGTTSTLATFDSNTFGASAAYQTQILCTAADWDFRARAVLHRGRADEVGRRRPARAGG
jgi:hypothetical protein